MEIPIKQWSALIKAEHELALVISCHEHTVNDWKGLSTPPNLETLARHGGDFYNWVRAIRPDIEEGDLIARLARSAGLTILPVTDIYPTKAAGDYVLRLSRRIPISPKTPQPWLPIDRMGPFIVMGHWCPYSEDFAGIPDYFVIRVMITRGEYDRSFRTGSSFLYPNIEGTSYAKLGALEMKPMRPPMDEDEYIKLIIDHAIHDEADELNEHVYDEARRLVMVDEAYMDIVKRKLSGVRMIPVDGIVATLTTYELLPRDVCLKEPVFCYYAAGNTRYVLISNPGRERELENDINQSHRLKALIKLVAVYASDKEIRRLQDVLSGSQVVNLSSGENDDWTSVPQEMRMVIDPAEYGFPPSEISKYLDDPVKILSYFFYRCIIQRASDLHIQPDEEGVLFRMRIEGKLTKVATFGIELCSQFIAAIKSRAGLNIAERRQCQDGRFPVFMPEGRIDCRVSLIPMAMFDTQSCVIRFFTRSSEVTTLEHLKIDDTPREQVEEAIASAIGIIVVSGPTGSGKTTTQASFIRRVNKEDTSIITIEDPIEIRIPNVKQFQVNKGISLDFKDISEAGLRHDPDIILVGEIRDLATMKVAIEAGNTGHLVICTVHANDAPSVIRRLKSLGASGYELSQALTLLQSQRLIKTVCSCARHRPITSKEAEYYKRAIDTWGVDLIIPEKVMEKRCCSLCGHGYRGQRAIMEFVPVCDDLAELIASDAEPSTIIRCAREYGYETMFEKGLRLVAESVTTFEEILGVRRPYSDMKKKIRVIKKVEELKKVPDTAALLLTEASETPSLDALEAADSLPVEDQANKK